MMDSYLPEAVVKNLRTMQGYKNRYKEYDGIWELKGKIKSPVRIDIEQPKPAKNTAASEKVTTEDSNDTMLNIITDGKNKIKKNEKLAFVEAGTQ